MTDITDLDLTHLKHVAENATPGQWIASYDDLTEYWQVCSPIAPMLVNVGARNNRDNAQFIAAANPTAILTLLDRIEELEAERDRWKERWQATVEDADSQRTTVQRVRDFADRLEAEEHPLGRFLATSVRQALEGDSA